MLLCNVILCLICHYIDPKRFLLSFQPLNALQYIKQVCLYVAPPQTRWYPGCADWWTSPPWKQEASDPGWLRLSKTFNTFWEKSTCSLRFVGHHFVVFFILQPIRLFVLRAHCFSSLILSLYQCTDAVASICTLYELSKSLAALKDKKHYEELNLGPLCKLPIIHRMFKIDSNTRDDDIHQIETVDILKVQPAYSSSWREEHIYRAYLLYCLSCTLSFKFFNEKKGNRMEVLNPFTPTFSFHFMHVLSLFPLVSTSACSESTRLNLEWTCLSSCSIWPTTTTVSLPTNSESGFTPSAFQYR